jgi:two-component system LytT family response regulator
VRRLDKYSALIVDDEPLARDKIQRFLDAAGDFAVVSHAQNGFEALDSLQSESPDVVFLDVKMPGPSGMDIASHIASRSTIQLVFTSAFSDFAAQAFAVEATDYLVKPFSSERFQQCLSRVRERIRLRALTDQHSGRRRDNGSVRAKNELLLKTGSSVLPVNAADIRFITSEGNYVMFHLREERALVRGTMHAVQRSLDPDRFLRVHRTVIVNKECVREFKRSRGIGSAMVILRDGTVLRASRAYLRTVIDAVELK